MSTSDFDLHRLMFIKRSMFPPAPRSVQCITPGKIHQASMFVDNSLSELGVLRLIDQRRAVKLVELRWLSISLRS